MICYNKNKKVHFIDIVYNSKIIFNINLAIIRLIFVQFK